MRKSEGEKSNCLAIMYKRKCIRKLTCDFGDPLGVCFCSYSKSCKISVVIRSFSALDFLSM